MLKPKNYQDLVRKTIILVHILLTLSLAIGSVQSKVITDSIVSQSLEGNLLNDPSTRSMTIYLPPSYDTTEDTRYPVIYYLHGYTANHTMWVNFFSIHNVLDNLIKQGKVQEMIIVMPDAFNRYGGSFYANSSVAGNYEDYITKDLVGFIDSKYRTLPQRESRAIGGGSMGGSGAMELAIKHPNVYCTIVCHSGVLSVNRLKDDVRLNPNATIGGHPVHRAKAIAWSPNPDNPLLYDYPADNKGNLLDDIWQHWLEHDPVTLIKTHKENLRRLLGIYFDHGKSDSNVNVVQAQDFHQALIDADIPHVYEEYAGGHTDQWTSRLYVALPFLSNLLSSEMIVAVHPQSKLAAVWGLLKESVR